MKDAYGIENLVSTNGMEENLFKLTDTFRQVSYVAAAAIKILLLKEL